MVLTVITLLLVLVGVVAYFIGAIKLAKYGFRLSKGVGLAVIFFPPYTFYFAFKKLEVDGKELPTAMVSFGLISSALLILIFWYPLMLFATFQFDELDRFMEVDKAPEGVVLIDQEAPTAPPAAAAPAPAAEAPAASDQEASAEEASDEQAPTEEEEEEEENPEE